MAATALLLDGGMGEELFKQGVPDDRKIWSAGAIVHPQYHPIVIKVHRDFLKAGAQVITANNFGITPGVGFSPADMRTHTTTALTLARFALTQHCTENPGAHAKLAMSLPPLVESYRPDLVMADSAQCIALYRQLAELGRQHAVDYYLAETLSSVREMEMAVRGWFAVQERGQGSGECDCSRVICSWTLGSNGRLRSGEDVGDAILYMLDLVDALYEKGMRIQTRPVLQNYLDRYEGGLEASGRREEIVGSWEGGEMYPLAAIMFNCCEPEAVDKAFTYLKDSRMCVLQALKARGIKVGASPNRLTPIDTGWTLEGSDEPQSMRDDMSPEKYIELWLQKWCGMLDVSQVWGGCCGMGPEYILAMTNFCKGVKAQINFGW